MKDEAWELQRTGQIAEIMNHIHILEEFKLVRISSNVPRETRFINKLRWSFFLYVLMIVLVKKLSRVRHLQKYSITSYVPSGAYSL